VATDRARKLRRLFADWIPFPAGGRGFIVNTGSEHLAGLALAARGPEGVEAVERDLLAARRLQAALPALPVRHAAHAAPSPGDQVLLPVDKDRRALFVDLAALARAVGPAGTLSLYGGRKEGIEPAVDFLAGFCALDAPVVRGGLRLVRAHPRADVTPPALDLPASFRATARGVSAEVACRPGVFSWRELDAATAHMLEHSAPAPGDRLLDLGCGNGVVSALLLAEGRVEHATLVDSDALALEAARATLELNGIGPERAALQAGDAGAELGEASFDLILCNPPFHRGFETDRLNLQHMIDASARLMAPRGRLYIVGPPALQLSRRLGARFRETERLSGDVAMELWRARQPQHWT
jgi:16S rRNA (guanine1207-N2)-methyltransferase